MRTGGKHAICLAVLLSCVFLSMPKETRSTAHADDLAIAAPPAADALRTALSRSRRVLSRPRHRRSSRVQDRGRSQAIRKRTPVTSATRARFLALGTVPSGCSHCTTALRHTPTRRASSLFVSSARTRAREMRLDRRSEEARGTVRLFFIEQFCLSLEHRCCSAAPCIASRIQRSGEWRRVNLYYEESRQGPPTSGPFASCAFASSYRIAPADSSGNRL